MAQLSNTLKQISVLDGDQAWAHKKASHEQKARNDAGTYSDAVPEPQSTVVQKVVKNDGVNESAECRAASRYSHCKCPALVKIM